MCRYGRVLRNDQYRLRLSDTDSSVCEYIPDISARGCPDRINIRPNIYVFQIKYSILAKA